MEKTKIKLDIPKHLVENTEKIRIVLYNDNGPKKNVVFNSVLPHPEEGSDKIFGDLDFSPFVRDITWFNILVSVKDGWKTVLAGIPNTVMSDNGEIFFEVNNRCRKDGVAVNNNSTLTRDGSEQKKLTQVEANFVNETLESKSAKQQISPPAATDMAKNLAASLANWAKKGFKIASEQTLNERLEICGKCELWDASGFAGTGKCKKCGCSTYAKLRLATSVCPLDPPKWVAE